MSFSALDYDAERNAFGLPGSEDAGEKLDIVVESTVIIIFAYRSMPKSLDKVEYRHLIFELTSMGLESQPQLFICCSSVPLDINKSLVISDDGLESEDSTVGVKFLNLAQFECMDIGVYFDLIRTQSLLFHLGV